MILFQQIRKQVWVVKNSSPQKAFVYPMELKIMLQLARLQCMCLIQNRISFLFVSRDGAALWLA